MIATPISFGKFASLWLPALAVTAAVEPAPRLADLFAIEFGGVLFPPVTCALGLLGVIAGRPLARRRETTLGWPAFALVTMIMLVTVQLWIIESRPGALFSFVVAIGLGFSGYSLIELLGDKIRAFIDNVAARASDTLGGSSKTGDTKK